VGEVAERAVRERHARRHVRGLVLGLKLGRVVVVRGVAGLGDGDVEEKTVASGMR